MLDYVLTVRDLLDDFPMDLPDPPPEHNIKFTIDPELGTRPISITPYRMDPTDFKDLNS